MQFVKPQPFTEAVNKLGSKSVIGSKLLSEHWRNVPPALRERAFFSSRVESARFLQTARDSIADYLTGALDPDTGALKTGSRADFVKQLQDFSVKQGLGSIDPDGKIPNDVTNLASERRVGLIFDTQTRQAQDFGYWQQGQDQDVLNAFPAQRFIRVRPVKEPRDMHQHHEGEVHLKTDLDFWTALNQDFGVPWGPWGWGCGHDVEEVDRAEAVSLGLLRADQSIKPVQKDFNERLEASVQNLDPDMRSALAKHFGDQVTITGDSARWTAAPAPTLPPTPEQ